MTLVQISDLGARIGRCLTFGEGIRLTPAEVAHLAECGAWEMIYKCGTTAPAPQKPSPENCGGNVIDLAAWRASK